MLSSVKFREYKETRKIISILCKKALTPFDFERYSAFSIENEENLSFAKYE